MQKLNSFISWVFIVFINLYRIYISSLLGTNCKFYPSCSAYSLEAFQKYNFYKALKKTIFRILKCHPLSRGGYDPIDSRGI